jgi:hypothetical protein
LRVLDEWLAHGDASEGDWAALVLRLARRRELARVGDWLLDLPALAQPFSCRSAECTPGRRASRTRSCCADIEVSLAPDERRAIERALPRLAPFFSRRDPRWRARLPDWHIGDALARPEGRCVFAVEHARGLRCGLQLAEHALSPAPGALKPLPCWLFPLVIVDVGEGARLLTAVHRHTRSLLDTYPPRAFPCLREDPARPPLVDAMRATLESFVGLAAFRRIRRAVRDFCRAAPHRLGDSRVQQNARS